MSDEYAYDRSSPAPGPRPPRVDCPQCGGDGLRSVRVTVHGLPYTDLIACTCAAGDERRQMIARARLGNEAEKAATASPYLTPPPAPPPPKREPLL